MLTAMARWLMLIMLGLNGVVIAAPRPNINVFMVDDYDKYEVSVYGGKVLTPNLDSLAREGITFENAHVTARFVRLHGILFLLAAMQDQPIRLVFWSCFQRDSKACRPLMFNWSRIIRMWPPCFLGPDTQPGWLENFMWGHRSVTRPFA